MKVKKIPYIPFSLGGDFLNRIEIAAVKVNQKINQLFPSSQYRFRCAAIITAAGSGTRLGAVSKPMFPLCHHTCLSYSLKAFDACEQICEIIVTVREQDRDSIEEECKTYIKNKSWKTVLGGEDRAASVERGFLAIQSEPDFVAIHDAARPLILPNDIDRILSDAKRYGAACAACKMTDTVKRANKNLAIVETVPRDDLFTVQTPQIFKTDLYRVALANAKQKSIQVTDDCALAEASGFSVHLTLIDTPNFKLTTKPDVYLIEQIIGGRSNA